MLRFQPDHWLDGLLRPFILLDPAAGIYFEEGAADLRFAALVLCLLLAIAVGRLRRQASGAVWRYIFSLTLMFYLWTFLTGNGRYFMTGLLLVGPLLVYAVVHMPGTRALRGLLLASLLVGQGWLVHSHYRAGQWAVAQWAQGQGLPFPQDPIRQRPAVFVTLSFISYSLLVPQFHPQSRWVNIAGQRDITAGMPEFTALQSLVTSPLPKYLVAPVAFANLSPQLQPVGDILVQIQRSLAGVNLQLSEQGCRVVRSHLEMGSATAAGWTEKPRLSFWVCALLPGAPPGFSAQETVAAPAWDEVFAAMERHCPRFFQAGGGQTRPMGGTMMRHYLSTDTRLYVDEQRQVWYRYFRAIDPTLVGTTDQVLRGDFEITCDRLPGRYVPPWRAG